MTEQEEEPKHIHVSIWTIIFFFCCLFLGYCNLQRSDEIAALESKNKMDQAAQAELKTYKDKDSLNHGRIQILYGSVSDLKSLHFKDSSTIARLQKLVTKGTFSATVFSDATVSSGSGKTQVIHDTVNKIKCDSSCYPVYTTSYSNKWEKVSAIAGKDSIHIDYTVYNDYSIVQKFEKQGSWPFRKEIPIIDITNNNPHTQTTALRSFALEPPGSKRGRWLVGGLLAGFAAGFLLAR